MYPILIFHCKKNFRLFLTRLKRRANISENNDDDGDYDGDDYADVVDNDGDDGGVISDYGEDGEDDITDVVGKYNGI